jgi:hypothetical protein
MVGVGFRRSRVLVSAGVSRFQRLAARVFVSAGDRDKRGGLLTSLGPNTRVCRSRRLAARALVSAGDVAGGGLSVWWSASDMGGTRWGPTHLVCVLTPAVVVIDRWRWWVSTAGVRGRSLALVPGTKGGGLLTCWSWFDPSHGRLSVSTAGGGCLRVSTAGLSLSTVGGCCRS